MSATVRIKPETYQKLKELAKLSKKPMNTVLEQAVETYRRQEFLDQCNRAYAALRKDDKAWHEELAERRLWDETLSDGLEDD